MSEFINGNRWMNGREVCRHIAKKLCENGAAVVHWVDLSEKWPCDEDPRSVGAEDGNGPIYTYRVMFSVSEFGTWKDRFVHMDAIQINGGNLHVGMSSRVDQNTYLPDAVAECLHGLVYDDSVPQYLAPGGDHDVYWVRPLDNIDFVYDEDDPNRKKERYCEEGDHVEDVRTKIKELYGKLDDLRSYVNSLRKELDA